MPRDCSRDGSPIPDAKRHVAGWVLMNPPPERTATPTERCHTCDPGLVTDAKTTFRGMPMDRIQWILDLATIVRHDANYRDLRLFVGALGAILCACNEPGVVSPATVWSGL